MATAPLNRVSSSLPITLHVGDQPTAVDQINFQISPRGMIFRSKAALPTWTEVSICMHLPSGNVRSPDQVDCHGVVINCRRQRGGGWKCAVLFLNLSKKAEARLTKIYSHAAEDALASHSRNGSSRTAVSPLALV